MADLDMSTSRVEAFGDGVMAIIITIMAFEAKRPQGADLRGPSSIALVAMSPSGTCFGALSDEETFSYSRSDVGQTSCDAADLPYPNPDWPGSDVAQR